MVNNRLIYSIIFFFTACIAFAQIDTSQHRGTIKIAKSQKEKVYIEAFMNFNNYNFSRTGIYAPFPGVEGYTFPFNYTRYFTEKFKGKEIDLRGKDADTIYIGIKILENGKAYIKDQTPSKMVKDIPTMYNERVVGYEVSRLQMDCIDFLKQIKSWEPAYVETPKKTKFKQQTVIKPEVTPLIATGILTIIFSSTPFEDY